MRLPHTCDLRYPLGGFGFENKPGSLGGLGLSACQEAGRKPAEFLSTPAPAHRAWQPMQVTAKLSLAKGQGHGAAGAGAEVCRWLARSSDLLRLLL